MDAWFDIRSIRNSIWLAIFIFHFFLSDENEEE